MRLAIFFVISVFCLTIIGYYLYQFKNINQIFKEKFQKKKMDHPEKKLSKKFPIVRVIVNAEIRDRTGRQYLSHTLSNLAHNFDNFGMLSGYKFYGYERESSHPNVKTADPRFELIRYKHDVELTKQKKNVNEALYYLKKEFNSAKVEHIKVFHEEALDWIEILKNFHARKCDGSQIFLYLEDEFKMCDQAMGHILSVYQWAERHVNDWIVIRLSTGLNGLLFQCKDIPQLVDVVITNSLVSHSLPLGDALSRFWDPFGHKMKRKHFTYRYNLFSKHIHGNNGCFDLMINDKLHKAEHFDWRCEEYMLSPCPESVKDLTFREYPKLDIPLNITEREKLVKRLGLSLHITEDSEYGESCSLHCQRYKLKCIPKAFQIVNNCELLRNMFKIDRCVNFIYRNEHFYPSYNMKDHQIHTLSEMISMCEFSLPGYQRACVCG
jgi:hypothetical protein